MTANEYVKTNEQILSVKFKSAEADLYEKYYA